MGAAGLDAAFVRWSGWRAALHRGWWLVTSVYLVVEGHLSAPELVVIGVAQSAVSLAFEVPAGVVADVVSRRWSLIVSHLLMGGAMIATGQVTGFGPLVATQMLWGLAWTFASGADVAWITDELNEPARIATVLMRAARAELIGGAAGMTGLGVLAWLIGRGTTMALAGAGMVLLGGYVAVRFRERRFVPAATARWSASWSTLRSGSALVRGSRVLLVVFAAAFLVNGVTSAFGRLYPLRLIDVELPGDPGAWVSVIGVLALVAGALALRVLQPHIDSARGAQRAYVVACAVAALAIIGLAGTSEKVSASLAVLLAAGALPLTRTIGTIWVNRQTGAAVRATVHSLLAQASALGAIICGLVIAAVAGFAALPMALLTGAALLAIAILLIERNPAVASSAR